MRVPGVTEGSLDVLSVMQTYPAVPIKHLPLIGQVKMHTDTLVWAHKHITQTSMKEPQPNIPKRIENIPKGERRV